MSLLKANLVALASLLAGASVVHYIYKPDLTIPIDEETYRQVNKQSKSVT